MDRLYFILLSCFVYSNTYSQIFTNIWELGYFTDSSYFKSEINFQTGTPVSTNFNRSMNFRSTNSSICDSSGNLLFYTNGIYIANSNHDTMLNGSGLNPGLMATGWTNSGFPVFQSTLILPWPDSANKYLMLHEKEDYDSNINHSPKGLLSTIIDMTLDGGLGGVTNKNNLILNDTLEIGLLTGCRHANGRDWWVLSRKYDSNIYYRILITPYGISSIDTQSVGGPLSLFGGESAFSPDGNWFATYDNLSMLRIYNFDRCTGLLSNLVYHTKTLNTIAGGLSFSPNSRFLYASTILEIFQYDLQASNIPSSEILVATYDGYYSPFPPFESSFLWQMLGPDGKIYISSLSSVVDLGTIVSPDSGGLACNVQQHSFYMGCFNKSSLPNHINYNLGRLQGSPCDTLQWVGLVEPDNFNFHLSITPNPVTDGFLKIMYLLPQNKLGWFEVFDVNGRKVYKIPLPQWSTLQQIKLPKLADGIYNAVITSGGYRSAKKIAVMVE